MDLLSITCVLHVIHYHSVVYAMKHDHQDIVNYLLRGNSKQLSSMKSIPDWKTYLASDCISSAGHVGGVVSFLSLFKRNVISNPYPDG